MRRLFDLLDCGALLADDSAHGIVGNENSARGKEMRSSPMRRRVGSTGVDNHWFVRMSHPFALFEGGFLACVRDRLEEVGQREEESLKITVRPIENNKIAV